MKLGRQRIWLTHRDYLIDKHELGYLFWECTLNCNFKCKHCWSNAWEKIIEETLNTDEIKNAFLDVSKNFDAKKITIAVTWWEPLLRKDLFEVMKYARSLGFSWWMVSNWSLYNEEFVKKAKDAWMWTIDLSIDWIGEIHDIFRNFPGSFERVIKTVKLFQKENFLNPLRITTTVHSFNIDTLELMHNYFLDLWIKDWRLLTVDPIWRAQDSDILLTKEQIAKVFTFIKNKRKSKSKIHVTYSCAHFLWDDFEDEVRWNFFFCQTGITVWSILHNWDIFVCPNVPRIPELIQWNVKVDSFSEVWKNKFEPFRWKNRTECDSCKKCDYWNECLGWSFHTWDFNKKEQRVCYLK